MERLLVVQNTATGGPGRLGRWLEEDGLALDVVTAYDGSPLPERLAHAGVLVLGGGFMPDDDARAPWLPATRALVAQALESDTAVLGICLGGQLLAGVAGGTVAAGHGRPEYGSTALTPRPEAERDPLFQGLPGPLTAIERHVDAVTALPPGASWLLASERCPYQAFRVGDRAWGLQFHPEAAADRILAWDAEQLAARGFDRAALHRAARDDEPAAAAVWRETARRFSRVVRRRQPF